MKIQNGLSNFLKLPLLLVVLIWSKVALAALGETPVTYTYKNYTLQNIKESLTNNRIFDTVPPKQEIDLVKYVVGFHRVGCYEEVEKNLGVEVDTLEDTVVSVYSAKNGDLLQKGVNEILDKINEDYIKGLISSNESPLLAEKTALAEKYYPKHYLFLDTSQANKGFVRYEAINNPHFNSFRTSDHAEIPYAKVNFKDIKICQYANLIALRKPVPEKSFTANALQLDFDETNVSPTLSFKDIPIIDGYTTPDAIVVPLPDVKDKELKFFNATRPEQETIFDKMAGT